MSVLISDTIVLQTVNDREQNIVDDVVLNGAPPSGTINPKPDKKIKSPKKLKRVAAGKVGNAKVLSPEQLKDIDAPNDLARVAAGKVGNSKVLTPEQFNDISAPRNLARVASPNIAAPNILNPKNPLAPPYPLSHARILYDNLFNNGIVSLPAAQGIANSNTYERWRLTGANQSIIVSANSNKTINAICLGAHNLGAVNGTVTIATSASTSAAFINRATVTPATNNAIMVLLTSDLVVRRIRLTVNSASAEIGILYAGLALVMPRPIFGGHAPITLQNKVNYIDSASENGQWLGRTITRRGYATSYTWSFITDAWYRLNFSPFVESTNLYPFFIAWRPDLYPDEVAYAWRTDDVTPTNRGGATRYIDFDLSVLGYSDK